MNTGAKMQFIVTDMANARAVFFRQTGPAMMAVGSLTPKYPAKAGTPLEKMTKAMFIPIPKKPQTRARGSTPNPG